VTITIPPQTRRELEMNAMMQFVIRNDIKPEVGAVMPMTGAHEAIRDMIEGRTRGKTVFTR
jgi:D-arabinose 1-dehydrogenase-like Zn-dependent alcohol dehydrogenase